MLNKSLIWRKSINACRNILSAVMVHVKRIVSWLVGAIESRAEGQIGDKRWRWQRMRN